MSQRIQFVSVKGRAYDADQVRPIVLALIRRRWRTCLEHEWIARVDARVTPEWLASRNGETPGALARALEDVAIGLETP